MIDITYKDCPKCNKYCEHLVTFIACDNPLIDEDSIEETTCSNCGYVHTEEYKEHIKKLIYNHISN